MDQVKLKGYAYGVIASVSYGLNPLFALPLYASGLLVDSVLFYRYAFAVLFLAVVPYKARVIPSRILLFPLPVGPKIPKSPSPVSS